MLVAVSYLFHPANIILCKFMRWIVIRIAKSFWSDDKSMGILLNNETYVAKSVGLFASCLSVSGYQNVMQDKKKNILQKWTLLRNQTLRDFF